MVDFAGWTMPVQYRSIVEEHLATRRAVGLFDISHMGRLTVTGPDAAQFLDCLLTRRVDDMRPGQTRYSLVCDADGGILDDVLVYCLEKDPAENNAGMAYPLVVNASNREKIVDWFKDRAIEFAARLTDNTLETAMIAVQGPAAVAIVDDHTSGAVSGLKYYRGSTARFDGTDCYVSRTGYTGEDGCEIVSSAEQAPGIWEVLTSAANALGGCACGLGARDTLRLEAAMPLYGHELSDQINPAQAGLRFAVTLGNRDFIGREACERFAADPNQPMRVGLHIEDRRVARQGAPVLFHGETAGVVTSGTFSPTLQRPIAMAYVQPHAAATGARLEVDVRGNRVPAIVVPLPFYKKVGGGP
jgi:aminomethyltransferase